MIKKINKKLISVVEMKDDLDLKEIESIERQIEITSSYAVDDIVGRKEEMTTLVSMLLSENSSGNVFHSISIVGMGGIGKTTLARLVYNYEAVFRYFDIRIWVFVSESFDQFKIAKSIVEALEGDSTLVDLDYLFKIIGLSIRHKKFLLVLDDVWTTDYNDWRPLFLCLGHGLPGSKILITTRVKSVPLMMESEVMDVRLLSDEDSWVLFSRLAFLGRSNEECKELEEIGREISSMCKGLPLAIRTMGSLLGSKRTRQEWQYILDNHMLKPDHFERGLLSNLWLSYNDLSSMIKLCLSYCAIFPRGYNITKDVLIKLWMAQGYLGLEKKTDMEVTGQTYFDHLTTRSFLQAFATNDSDEGTHFQMHDLLLDFLQFCSNGECLTTDISDVVDPSGNSSHRKVRHLILKLNEGAPFPMVICGFKRLRSLLIEREGFGTSLSSGDLSKLFCELSCLRALKLDGLSRSVNKIPEEIRKLIQLRYLDLSRQDIKQLPDGLCELYNLQTLDISFCGALAELPQGIGKLANLRHLINKRTDSLRHMPIGIKKLTCLRTLSEFIVSGGGDDSKIRRLDCLKDFIHLQGELTIRGLGNLTVSENTRKQVLTNKKNLVCLNLNFFKDGDEERINRDDEVLHEVVQLPPNLEELTILCYRGIKVSPNWMMSSTKLRLLRLETFPNCKHLPPLGHLPSLEILDVWGMGSLKKVGEEFCGIESDTTSSSSPSSVVLFPKLKELFFGQLTEWEEWDYGFRVKGEEEEKITIMPHLASLRIHGCPKLKALPDHLLRSTTLNLDIWRCPTLEERRKKTVEGGSALT